jgi:hypothetical protein
VRESRVLPPTGVRELNSAEQLYSKSGHEDAFPASGGVYASRPRTGRPAGDAASPRRGAGIVTLDVASRHDS